MHRFLILTLILTACGGKNKNEGDADTDPADDTGDVHLDTLPDEGPDIHIDPLEDAIADATDEEEDVTADVDDDTTAACLSSGGSCVAPVGGCTRCPSGTLPYHMRHGCIPPGWCCMPGTRGETECETAGGICIPVIPDAVCAPGWNSSSLACTGEGAGCCQPSDDCV